MKILIIIITPEQSERASLESATILRIWSLGSLRHTTLMRTQLTPVVTDTRLAAASACFACKYFSNAAQPRKEARQLISGQPLPLHKSSSRFILYIAKPKK
jgi:hypothetical protein